MKGVEPRELGGTHCGGSERVTLKVTLAIW